MIVSIATAVLPVCRSPMISWRWPRPIGGHRVDGLDAGLQRLLAPAGAARRWAPAARARGGPRPRSSPRPSIGLPSGSTTRPRKPSPTGTERISPVRRDLLALLDAAELAEEDDADLADVEVQREAEQCRPRTRAARWSSPRAGPRRGRCRHRSRRHVPTSSRGGLRRVRRDVALERVADLVRADRQLGHLCVPALSGRRCVAVRRVCWCVRVRAAASSRRAAGGPRPSRWATRAVDDLVADPDARCRRRRSGSTSTLQVHLRGRRAGARAAASRARCSLGQRRRPR